MGEGKLRHYSDISCIDRSVIQQLFDLFEDHQSRIEFLHELINTYEASGRLVIEDLMQALRSNDNNRISALAHRLKGQGRNIGAQRLGFLAEDLEVWANDSSNSVDDELKAYCHLMRDEFYTSCRELRSQYLSAVS